MSAHALLSPSGAHRWMSCPGSVVLEKDMPDNSSKYSEEGTLAHEVANALLIGEAPPLDCSLEMYEEVGKYVALVQDLVRATDGVLMVEVRVDMSEYVPGCWGTSDAIIVAGDELIVIDLKYGKGVRVDAEGNEQLRLYALGAYAELNDTVGPFTRVRSIVHQPRLDHVSEESLQASELLEFAGLAKVAAVRTEEAIRCSTVDLIDVAYLTPGDACMWCKAKASCPALRATVAATTGAEFFDIEQEALPEVTPTLLSLAMAKVDLIEDWCKAVRAAVERALFSGEDVEGWKLVDGRLGARAWADPSVVEVTMRKQFRMKEDVVYEKKLISPTEAEKRMKDKPKQWATLQELIVRAPGKPSVAPVGDKRPALKVAGGAEDFEVIE